MLERDPEPWRDDPERGSGGTTAPPAEPAQDAGRVNLGPASSRYPPMGLSGVGALPVAERQDPDRLSPVLALRPWEVDGRVNG